MGKGPFLKKLTYVSIFWLICSLNKYLLITHSIPRLSSRYWKYGNEQDRYGHKSHGSYSVEREGSDETENEQRSKYTNAMI